MTLPTTKDIADELILTGHITAEMFFHNNACHATTSMLPWQYLVTNYYHQHNLVDETELSTRDIHAVRDAVFTGVITDVITTQDFKDIVREAYKAHGVTPKDLTTAFNEQVSKWSIVMSESALEAVHTLETRLTPLLRAVVVAYQAPKTVKEPDTMTACLAMTIHDVLIDDDMDDYIANGARP